MLVRKRISISQVLLALLLFALTLTMLVPLLNILAKSLSSPTRSISMGGLKILPQELDFLNYRIVFSHPILVPSLINSIIITVVGTIINISLTTTAAYVLTRPNLTLKRPIMVFLIIMMLFDPGLVPEYIVVQKLGLMGSKWSVILVTAVNVYYLVIMMRYFEKVPQSIVEAATIDGANHIQMLTRIFYPLSKAGVATITMFYAVVRWNEYFRAGIYLTRKSTDTVLQVVLRQFVVLGDTVSILGQQNVFDYNALARADYSALKGATIIVAIIPILIIYPFVLRFYAKDILSGGIKE
ncbi:carbohydrate ABC transporter permease [uncultured Sphaerochaeta sp.]|uniref:carbohydrate ABC transporter permease n=1 Tax=uncultured Sphaerochaeta sp. TaxID=886478 RepID=UPI002A3E0949|nr:carbohydrate ABC transporter permease [uncultured Sphaerochaeta sp.]MDY0245133.1 carbohydrate ABC transporter permease [Sphaerochaeta sp.]